MQRTVVAIRHVHFEHLGTFGPVLESAGWAVRYVEGGIDDIRHLDAAAPGLLAVLGGPIGAYEEDKYPFLADELRLIERRLASGRPIVGICLGAQLMARALGSSVYPGPAKEIGWHPLSLSEAGLASPLRHLGDIPVMHWHGDTFDLPQGAERLASTAICSNQAFSFGDTALGLQFHAEVDAGDIERWLIGHACEIAAAGLDVTGLRGDAALHGKGLAAAGSRLLQDWLAKAVAPGLA